MAGATGDGELPATRGMPVRDRETALMRAVCQGQWQDAVVLVQNGVQVTQEMVDEVFLLSGPGVLGGFLGMFPVMPSALKTMLIKGAVEFGGPDILRDLLRRYYASGQDRTEAFEHVASRRNGEALLVLVGTASTWPLLKQFCALKLEHFPPGNFTWMCWALKEKHVLLSLDIAFATDSWDFVEGVILGNKTSGKVRRMFLQKVCAHSEERFQKLAESLVVRFPHCRRSVFLMSVRRGYNSVALALYGKGVPLGDVKFALAVVLTSVPEGRPQSPVFDLHFCSRFKFSKWQNIGREYMNKLDQTHGEDSSNISKLLKWLVTKEDMTKTGECLILTWLELFCAWEKADTGIVASIFRWVYKKAVRSDHVPFFVSCLNVNVDFVVRRVPFGDTCEDGCTPSSAFDFAFEKQRYCFLSRALMARLINCRELVQIILPRVIAEGAWPVLDMLFEREFPGASAMDSCTTRVFFCQYGKEFKDFLFTTMFTRAGEEGAIRVLDKWLRGTCDSIFAGKALATAFCDYTMERNLGLGKCSAAALRLAARCNSYACHSLEAFLALMVGAAGKARLESVARLPPGALPHDLVFDLACYALRTMRDPAAAVVLLAVLPLSAFWSPLSYLGDEMERLCSTGETSDQQLLAALRERGVHRWVLVCQLVGKKFEEVDATLALCHARRQECVEFVVRYCARVGEFGVVSRLVLLRQTSGDRH